jgi:phenylacetate-CoA ligase
MRYGNKLTSYIYYNSPSVLRNLYAAVYDAKKSKVRFADHFRTYLAFLHESQYWTNERIIDIEWSKARTFLSEAYRSSRYYHSLFDAAGISPDGLKDPGIMTRLPFLTKEIVKERSDEIMTAGLDRKNLVWEHTSGTTGTSLRFPSTPEVVQEYYAIRELQFRWAGFESSRKYRVAYFGGHPVVDIQSTRPPFWVRDPFRNDIYFSSYHISEKTVEAYMHQLARFAPDAIVGYPSSIYLVAEGILRRGFKLSAGAVVTTSETLLEPQKRSIEAAFSCKVFDFYGNTENCGKILTCEHDRKHLLHQGGISEVVNGELIVTNTTNRAFPFIRYRVGDKVVVSQDQKCACGRNGLILDSIEGRLEDYIVTADGRMVGRLDHIFKDAVRVKEAQILQEKNGEVSIRIVKGAGYGMDDENNIRKEASTRLGPATKISFKYVDHIERTTSGKFRFILTGQSR